jgi:hypothetical protein
VHAVWRIRDEIQQRAAEVEEVMLSREERSDRKRQHQGLADQAGNFRRIFQPREMPRKGLGDSPALVLGFTVRLSGRSLFVAALSAAARALGEGGPGGPRW